MADTFTREDISTKGPKFAPAADGFDPWSPNSTPAGETKSPEPKVEAKTTPEPVSVKTESETPASDNSDDGSTPVTAESGTATAEPDGETPSESAEEAVTSPRRSEARERIEELVTERNALRKYGEYLLETVKQLQNKPAESTPATTPSVGKEDSAPTLEQFEYDPTKYARAQNEWMQRQIDKQVKQAVDQIQVQQTTAQMRATFESRVSEFKKSHPDFDLVLSNPTLPTLHRDAAAEIIKSAKGPDIAFHLAKNPDLAARIARMEPMQQLMALGRVEAQLTAEVNAPAAKTSTPSKPRTVTQAPPPPKPVDTGTNVAQKPESIMSMDEWVAKDRERKIAEKEARRKMRSAMR